VRETAPGTTIEDIRSKTEAELIVPEEIAVMAPFD